MIELDVHTLWVWLYVSEGLFGLLLAIVWNVRRSEQALVYWVAASLSLSMGCLGLSLRGQVADWLSIPIANVLVGFALTLRWAGLRAFAGQPLRASWVAAVPLLIGLGFQFRDQLQLDGPSRVAIMSAGGSLYASLIVVDSLRAQRKERLTMRIVIATIACITITFELIRGAEHLLFGTSSALLSQSLTNSSMLLVFLNIFALFDLASFLMVFERHESRLVREATVDSLTNLLNRVGFSNLAGRQLLRSTRDGKPVSVLLMDLDYFKKVNDTYGHEAGDAVLQAFSGCARAALRPSDLVSRPGGEEFWALVPNAGLDEACRVAQRVCDRFRAMRVHFSGHLIASTVSIGVAEIAPGGETIEAALARADRALYEAKHQGRDRVVRAATVPAALQPAHA